MPSERFAHRAVLLFFILKCVLGMRLSHLNQAPEASAAAGIALERVMVKVAHADEKQTSAPSRPLAAKELVA